MLLKICVLVLSLLGMFFACKKVWGEFHNKWKKIYKDGVCPDCQETIPFSCADGEGCRNCGHTFYLNYLNNDLN